MDWMDGWMDERNRMERAMGSRRTGGNGAGGTGAPGNGEWKVWVIEG